jgi:predicted nuclease of predicted toxin-antitoxin system
MLKLAVDEDFDNDIIRGLLRQEPELDILRMQDAGLAGAKDPTVLEWAAQEGRVLLTHDVNTMTKFAYERVRAGQPMPGVFVVRRNAPLRVAIEDILLVVQASSQGEWEGQVRYIPF